MKWKKRSRNLLLELMQMESRERHLNNNDMTQPNNEVVGFVKPAHESTPNNGEQVIKVVELFKEEIKPIAVVKEKHKYIIHEYPIREERKKEIIRPDAIYTQSTSPFGIADELHRRNLKK